jgi:hypothetical protein
MSQASRARAGGPQPSSVWTTAEADNAVKALAEATGKVGITIPSLGREYMSLDFPLVELGKVRPDVAVQLARALTELVDLREKVTGPQSKGDAEGESAKEEDDG